ncbi:hypothetical protein [Streptomyces zagrosensis]|uniref:Uncharacterized protein n=1 Tax=Streptomyces zagrosensis TaxID=1042984 RepID=A0A7W9Q7A3_9ACTN|nr:hypothetical protein [Streptomyces zagrosensis]MBB5934943.1 hypothetical protein [Streptomyces zagrosensis]
MGDWVLTAVPTNGPRGFTRAHLQRGVERVEVRYCLAELVELAATVARIETEFIQGCDELRRAPTEMVHPHEPGAVLPRSSYLRQDHHA